MNENIPSVLIRFNSDFGLLHHTRVGVNAVVGVES